MQRQHPRTLGAFSIVFAALTLLAGVTATACGDTDAESDPTPVTTWKITPASGTQTPPPATEAPDTPTPGTPGTPGAGTVLELAAVSSTFDAEEFEAPAGPVTIEFDNRDAGIVHNVQVFAGDSADGESMGATELEVGPVQQTLEMTLEAGEYYYQCDAHPTTMSGTLTVT